MPEMDGMPGPMWMPNGAPTAMRLLATHLQPVPAFPALCVLLLLAYSCC